MNIIAIAILVLLAFILQYALTYLQMKGFNTHYSRLRKMGRVAIGRKKGALRAGAIVMLAIDENANIIAGSFLQGITVLARFKNFDGFIGINIVDITEEYCKALRLSKSLTLAVLDARDNYITISEGGEVEMPQSPLQKLGGAIVPKK